jgi:hypothetical protein
LRGESNVCSRLVCVVLFAMSLSPIDVKGAGQMRVLICFCALNILQINAVLAETLTYKCNPWTNAGLRLKGDVTLTLSGLELVWTNGKLSQTAIMINPDDKLEFNTTDAKRVYLTDDSTAVLFVKRFDGYAEVLRTLVTVRESKQNKTTCHLDR